MDKNREGLKAYNAKYAAPVNAKYSNEELAGLIPCYLRKRRETGAGGATYNEVAGEFGVHFAQANAVLEGMAASALTGVYMRLELRYCRKRATYYSAPERKRIDADPSRRDVIVKEVIEDYVWDVEAATEYQIRAQCVRVLVSCAVPVVRRCLAALVESGRLVAAPGPRNARIYRQATGGSGAK